MACTSYTRVFREMTPWEPWAPAQTLILGDSIIKLVGVIDGCGLISYPGAKIKILTDRVSQQVVAFQNVLIHVGTNCLNSESFIDDYVELIKMIQNRSIYSNTVVVMSAILPRPGDAKLKVKVGNTDVNMMVVAGVKQLNYKLQKLAKTMVNVKFLGSAFTAFELISREDVKKGKYDRRYFAWPDRVHLTMKGSMKLRRIFIAMIMGRLHIRTEVRYLR